jgi:hypothetical protein
MRVTSSIGWAWMLPSAHGPRGNQSRRFPPSAKPTDPPSATGADGSIQAAQILQPYVLRYHEYRA